MNYEEMSDFEINKLVVLNSTCLLYKWVFVKDDVIHFSDTGPDDVTNTFDPCNNQSDALLVISDDNIQRAVIKNGDKNPLRSSMIVFLKMNEES